MDIKPIALLKDLIAKAEFVVDDPVSVNGWTGYPILRMQHSHESNFSYDVAKITQDARIGWLYFHQENNIFNIRLKGGHLDNFISVIEKFEKETKLTVTVT